MVALKSRRDSKRSIIAVASACIRTIRAGCDSPSGKLPAPCHRITRPSASWVVERALCGTMRGAMDDLELLWEFGRSRSPAAFETVARRYVDLIYSSALRQVRDPHVADDVTQAVLIVMMNKAAKLPARTVLPSWLLKVTRYACMDVMKMDARRR